MRIDRFADDHSVVLADGTAVSADVVLVGVGATPDLGWLAGLDTGNGLACDAQGRVVGAAKLWAVGDVAAWWDPVRERHHRAEHWTSTVDQAAVVARDVLGMEPPTPGPPYVWSDQFGLKIQVLGRPDLADETVPLHGAGLDGGPVRGTVVGYLAGDTLVAVAGFGAARHLPRYRPLVGAAGASRRLRTPTAWMPQRAAEPPEGNGRPAPPPSPRRAPSQDQVPVVRDVQVAHHHPGCCRPAIGAAAAGHASCLGAVDTLRWQALQKQHRDACEA